MKLAGRKSKNIRDLREETANTDWTVGTELHVSPVKPKLKPRQSSQEDDPRKAVRRTYR